MWAVAILLGGALVIIGLWIFLFRSVIQTISARGLNVSGAVVRRVPLVWLAAFGLAALTWFGSFMVCFVTCGVKTLWILTLLTYSPLVIASVYTVFSVRISKWKMHS